MIEYDSLTVETLDGRTIVDAVTTTIGTGRIRAVVGESGCGKTTLALALLGMVRRGLRCTGGTVSANGDRPLTMNDDALRAFRRHRVAWLGQDPSLSLTPWMTVNTAMCEVLDIRPSESGARARVATLLDRVGLPGATLLDRLPGELSGGQRRRVAFARTLANDPEIVVLDEPTSGLDPEAVAEVLDALQLAHAQSGSTIILITHDLDVARRCADEITVIDAGRILETFPVGVLDSPSETATLHPRTRALWAAARLDQDQSQDQVSPEESSPSEQAAVPVLSVDNFTVFLPDGTAVCDPVTFELGAGESLAVTGPSGIGKSTLAFGLVGMGKFDGALRLGDTVVAHTMKERNATTRRAIQVIPQDPVRSLNPAVRVGTQLRRAVLRARPRSDRAEVAQRIRDILDLVQLDTSVLGKRPRSLSGGEGQRVAIARALAHEPGVLICDESTAALDPTVQKEVLDTLNELRDKVGLVLIMITHSPEVARYTCDREWRLGTGELSDRPRDLLARGTTAGSPTGPPARGSSASRTGRYPSRRGR